ncbi:FAD-dependent oxidoreductase domain-containing protein 1 isoform X1 [Patella vulgata]|uniref:FAD-dependent oxidoreductase domain-containing protein 1 isoform X1 n=2 Tax=Patella vulgata TaxID=6465 RepID=UPI0021800910|nr:FAD-dependent oxidoreductase domain-containing protein 1 isoform X1 [Patella vulgata]XP_050393191.1 FAD-dependent oxidoreductase domain-containing protein 1 isoform X1 [Patella vulgata]
MLYTGVKHLTKADLLPRLLRYYSTKRSGKKVPPGGHYRSPWKILKDEFTNLDGPLPTELIPREVDALVIGGGLVGSSVAFWLKHLHPKAFSVALVERDLTYSRASSMLSAGGVRHQFSVPENVQLSLFATDFLRNIKQYLSVLDEEDPPDVKFNHHGYLFLTPEDKAEELAAHVKMQNELGARIKFLTKDKLAQQFPWLNLQDVEVGSYGLQGEGWFDPWLLIKSFFQKNISYGVNYIHGELDRFNFKSHAVSSGTGYIDKKFLDSAVVNGEDGNEYGIKFSHVINCAGPWAGEVARKAIIGIGSDVDLAFPLPVTPRKRFVYVVNCPNGPGLETPVLIDPAGVYFRREGLGGNYICGGTPSEEREPSTEDLSIDYSFFEEAVKPQLEYRIPTLKNLKLKSAWSCYHDYNEFDENLVIGRHPFHNNFLFANGLGGHAVQHSIGVGRAIAELIMAEDYKSIDLSKFGFDRFLRNDFISEEMRT